MWIILVKIWSSLASKFSPPAAACVLCGKSLNRGREFIDQFKSEDSVYFSLNPFTQWYFFSPLLYWRFYRPKTKVLWEVVKLLFAFFFHRGIRRNEKSRLLRYGLPLYFLSKKENSTGGIGASPTSIENKVKLKICNKHIRNKNLLTEQHRGPEIALMLAPHHASRRPWREIWYMDPTSSKPWIQYLSH